MTTWPLRSKLFVPGTRPELFDKAAAGAADALSLDLEDSVAPSRKAEARAAVVRWLQGESAARSGKCLIVRCNALDSEHFDGDLQALCAAGLGWLNLPKIESVEQVRQVGEVLDRLESTRANASPMRLLLTIETPGALRESATLAAAHPRVAGLQLGLGDLFEPHGIDRRDPANLHAALFALRLGAAEAGVVALDGAYANLADDAGFQAEAGMARRLGFAGKSCIHPRQVALANAAFAPTEAELEQARRTVEAAREAAAEGRAVCAVDGRMVDAPYLQRAQALLALAERENRA